MNLASLLFQSAELRLQGKTICRTNDFLTQVDTLEHRLSKSKSWFDSVGAASNFWQADLDSRIKQVSSDGVEEYKDIAIDKTRVANNVGVFPFAADSKIAVAADTGLVTFATAGDVAIVGLGVVFLPGDVITIPVSPTRIAQLRIAHVEATRVTVDFASLPDALASANYPWTLTRRQEIASRRLDAFEVAWQPLSLSVFKLPHALPVGDYELVLNSQTANAFRQRAVQSLGADVVGAAPGVAGANFQFGVEQIYLYVATFESQRVDNLTYYLDLQNTRCQSDDVAGTGLQQKQFDVSPSAYALTVAYQAGEAGGGTETRLSASQFKLRNAGETKLNRFFIQYNGVSRPAPDADPQYKLVGQEDYMVQRYIEDQIHSGGYFDTGGTETIEEWLERGLYLHFKWPKDGSSQSTRVSVHYSFGVPPAANSRVLLFDHYYSYVTVQIKDGRVQMVESIDN
jgi:hypothetical protein